MRAARIIVVIPVFAALAAGISAAQVENADALHDQTTFTEDARLQHPVPVSSDVLKVLLETDAAKEGMAFAQVSKPGDVAQLFRAGEVHLGGANEVDLVVIGVGWMSGADNGWFWVVRSAHKNPRVVLFAGGNSLQMMVTRTNGYRDIRSTWSSPSETDDTIYHFDGREYKLWKKTSTENRR
jgi:hypothetical protein